MKRTFLKTIFEKLFAQISTFEVFSKGIKFPESGVGLLVTFDTFELMSFFDDCGKCLFSFLVSCHSGGRMRSKKNFTFSKKFLKTCAQNLV